ncbi:hypothetical protein K2X33_11000, partial [bacterium]|nr:hypothetical protein [bacterium]
MRKTSFWFVSVVCCFSALSEAFATERPLASSVDLESDFEEARVQRAPAVLPAASGQRQLGVLPAAPVNWGALSDLVASHEPASWSLYVSIRDLFQDDDNA